jgi:hypothetical protein
VEFENLLWRQWGPGRACPVRNYKPPPYWKNFEEKHPFAEFLALVSPDHKFPAIFVPLALFYSNIPFGRSGKFQTFDGEKFLGDIPACSIPFQSARTDTARKLVQGLYPFAPFHLNPKVNRRCERIPVYL